MMSVPFLTHVEIIHFRLFFYGGGTLGVPYPTAPLTIRKQRLLETRWGTPHISPIRGE